MRRAKVDWTPSNSGVEFDVLMEGLAVSHTCLGRI